MATNLKMVGCINCCLLTRADWTMCQHGDHRRDRKMALEHAPHPHPTAEDREDYFLWLSQQNVSQLVH